MGIEVGDGVILHGNGRNNIGVVQEIERIPGEPELLLLTLEVPASGRMYWTSDEVTSIDKPKVRAGQVWHCDETGTTVRALERAWYSEAVWETDTLTAGRWAGTLILAHPAWRLLSEPEDEVTREQP